MSLNKLFLCFFLLLNPLQLLGSSHCEKNLPLPDPDPELVKIMKEIGHHSCSDEEILNAFCKTTTTPSVQQMDHFIASQKNEKRDDEMINGTQFNDESTILLDAYRELTTPLHHLGLGLSSLKSKGTLQESFNINPECDKVECAVKKIWGEEMGTQVLYVYLAYGQNTSEYSYTHSTRFSAEEMNDVLLTLGDLPKDYQRVGWHENERGIKKEKLASPYNERPKAQRLSRYTFPNPNNPKQLADASIALFDLWSTESKAKRQYTIYHELAHNIASRLDQIDLSEEWLGLSGWKKTSKRVGFDPDETWASTTSACFISGYSTGKPQEDFAEAVTAYRYAPQRFKNLCPEKYSFIKEKVYNNKEYLDDKDC